ncbi:MAG TPA: hypothetical protein VGO61_14440 [Steroidobacteraceae bacterium]|jgi:hypothetical protein|nr:hypothetical protein [Steroidobacteraceae bacterium]
MTKPTYFALGAGLALAIFWLAMRDRAPLPVGQSPSASAVAQSAPVADASQPASPGPLTVPRELVNAASEVPSAPNASSALPIDVTPGFEMLNTKTSSLKNTDPRKPLLFRHEELQEQPRDAAWSEQMESTLRNGIQDSLTAHGVDAQRVELPVVECRATGCEIQAIGFREDISKAGVGFQMIVSALLMGPLNSELDNPHGTMSRLPDGRVSYIVLLGRRGK